jgi:hypothetical protein
VGRCGIKTPILSLESGRPIARGRKMVQYGYGRGTDPRLQRRRRVKRGSKGIGTRGKGKRNRKYGFILPDQYSHSHLRSAGKAKQQLLTPSKGRGGSHLVRLLLVTIQVAGVADGNEIKIEIQSTRASPAVHPSARSIRPSCI